MCASCISHAEVVVGQAGLAFALLREPVHKVLADAGFVAALDPVKRDVRTVAFLRSLDLDPVEILGTDVVDAAERWVPLPSYPRRWALPIGSQSRLATQ